MAYLTYQDGNKEFVPLIITVESIDALSALYSVAAKAAGVTATDSVVYGCAEEMKAALRTHAEENGVIIKVSA